MWKMNGGSGGAQGLGINGDRNGDDFGIGCQERPIKEGGNKSCKPLEPNLPRSEEEFTWPSEVVNQVEREMQDELFSPLSVIQEGEKERINFAAIAKSFTPPGRSLEDKLLKMEWDEDDGTFYPAIEETEVNIGGRIVRLMDLAMKNAWNGNPSFTNMEENITLPEPTPVWMFAADCNYCCSMRYIPTKVQPNQYWLSILLDEEED